MVGKKVKRNVEASEETVSLVQEYPLFSLTQTDNQKAFNEKVANAIEQMMPLPSYVVPTIVLANIPTLAEVGASMQLILKATFTQNDAGAIRQQAILKGDTVLAHALTHTDSFTMPNATLSYTARTSYEQGAVKQNSLGVEVEKGRIPAGSITSTAKHIKGVYPVFFGVIEPTQSIDNVNVSNLTKSVVDSVGNVSCSFNFVGKRMVIAIPKVATQKTAWFVTELNKGTIGNAGDLFAAPVEKIISSPELHWNNIAYNIYVSSPTTLKGAMQLRNS
ncbi:hypothetical protein [Capnocytophaga canis]|uniref:hypothetical protein n=1 Tax=Capnocytophaga canis TaxID=1848903 RepID=UPI0015623BAA|nr:hypothetical protein [Capnocytophaga canis]